MTEKKRTGIVPFMFREELGARLKPGDAYYANNRKVGTVKAVLSSSYLIEIEDDVKVTYASAEETAEMVDKGAI